MTSRVLLLVGTKKGAFILESDADAARLVAPRAAVRRLARPRPDRRARERRDPGRRRQPVVRAGRLALARTWARPGRTRPPGLTYGDEAEPITTIWSLAATPDGGLLAGVEPAGLFRSDDHGGRRGDTSKA